jgi:phage pi2 protein 07
MKKFTMLLAALLLMSGLTWAQTTINWTAADQGYGNGDEITSVTFDDNVSGTFAKGTGSNAPKYYSSGTAIRCYGGNTITIVSSDANLTTISITFGSSDGSNAITTDVGTYSDGTWTGDAESVTFTIGGSSGNRRIAAFAITYGGDAPTPTVATPTFNPAAGTYTETQTVEISCTTDGATIYYTLDGNDPTTESAEYTEALTIEETTTVKAFAVKEGFNNSAIATATYTITAPVQEQVFSRIDGHAVEAGQTYLIVDVTSGRALTSANGSSSAPAAVEVTIENDQIATNNVALQWTFEATDGGYIIYPLNSTTTWLYSTDANNGVRVGTNDNKVWALNITDNNNPSYHGFKNTNVNRYLGVYFSNNAPQDWRAYGSINNNIKNTQIELFVLGDAPTNPTITADNVDLAYDAVEGTISYTINNPVESGVLTAEVTEGYEWISADEDEHTEATGTVALITDANTTTTVRTATVTLTYTYENRETVTKEVTVTQAAAPVAYTTIPALFEAATSTETDVTVTFGGWVISAVKNSNAYLTDNAGNGLIIYQSDHGFQVNDVLTGTASCKLLIYRGSAELKNLTATTEGLTVTPNGTVTVQNIAISELSGVNTGALVAYENLTYTDGKLQDSEGNQITPYNTLYDYGNIFVEGHVYNVTGIYLQYNTTKEILPRSAADIEEVTVAEPSITVEPATVSVPATEADGTLTVTYENITEIVAEVYFCDADGEAATYEWITAEINDENNVYYVIDANEGEARTAYLKVYALDDAAGDVYSNLVTVNQEAYVAPPVPGEWVMTRLADLTEDDVFVIVGVYDADESSYAMPNDGTGAPSAVEVTMVGNTLSGDIADNLKWNIGISEDGYIFYPNGETETWLYCTNANNGVRVGTNENNVFSMTSEGYLFNNATERYIGIYNSQDWRCYTSINNNIKDQTFAFYKRVDESEIETYTLDITGYGTSAGGYYLIASPVSMIRPTAENGFLTNEYDLYYFDQAQQGEEWRNYEAKHFNIASGKGYLYASQESTTLTFTGAPYEGDGVVTLSKTDDVAWSGWNLIGNPYAEEAYFGQSFYRMNEDGSEIVAVSAGMVNPMEGIFALAEEDGDEVQFDDAIAGGGNLPVNKNLVLNLNHNQGGLIDRAFVNFDESNQLPKFQLNPNSTKICFTLDETDFAVVRSDAQGEMPVSFKAAENGTYTLSVNVENMDVDYLHLIDNMTGMDIDLLQTPSYSFEANTTDYTTRFRLVFSTSTSIGENNDSFAFFSNGRFIVSNEGQATLQVIDVTGRIVSDEIINGTCSVSVDTTPGVYMLRLVSGNNVKIQKVVVK